MKEIAIYTVISILVVWTFLKIEKRRIQNRKWKGGYSIKEAKEYLENNTDSGKVYKKKAYFDRHKSVIISSPLEMTRLDLVNGKVHTISKIVK